MKGDFTRFTFDPKKHYSGIRMQQGRVQLDSDWNELVDIHEHRMRTESEDFIGPCGAPRRDPGFAIGVVDDGTNLTVSPGRMYVDGILCENEEEVALTSQSDLPGEKLPSRDGLYLAYLEVWHRHITALEEPTLREAGLGGPDTATRIKTVWQVKLERIEDAESIPGEWQKLTAPADGRLRARWQGGVPSENRLYRIEIHEPGALGQATFKWSSDNAFRVAELDRIADDRILVKGATAGGPAIFSTGQWVELADEKRTLRGEPGILVEIEAVEGDALTVRGWSDGRAVTADDFCERLPVTVRAWDSVSTVEIPAKNDGFLALEGGLEVRFESGDGSRFDTGDYWLVPVRTNSVPPAMQHIDWPPDPAGQLPYGIHRHYCRLALVERHDGSFQAPEDVRFVFSSLTDLKELNVVAAAANAPDGAIYVDEAGNVGIGTKEPETGLHVDGLLQLHEGVPIHKISNETLSANAASVPTEKTVKSYVDAIESVVPAGYSILGETPEAPPGYQYTGLTINPSWSIKADMPTARSNLAIGVVKGKIYAIGGRGDSSTLKVTEEFDPVTNTWTPKADMPTAREDFAIGVVNDRIYAIGGLLYGEDFVNATTANQEYDPATDTWTPKANMPTARGGLAIGVANNRIYAIGGAGPNSAASITEEYDPAADAWSRKEDIPSDGHHLAIGVVENRIYAIGGARGTAFKVVEEYDPATDTWTRKADLREGKYRLAIAVVKDRIYTIGGYTPGGKVYAYSRWAEEYDPATDDWRVRANIPTGRVGGAVGVVDNAIYLIGAASGPELVAAGGWGGPNATEALILSTLYVHRKT